MNPTNSTNPAPAPAPFTEPAYPYPPRFRWLKRGAVFALVVVFALVALRVWWGREANRRLARVVDELTRAASPCGRRTL